VTTAVSAPPRFRSVPLHASTLGRDAEDLAECAGLTLDGWQADILEAAMGLDAAGRWAAMEVALVVPRQNGKGGLLEALELAHLFLVPTTQLITHTAHRFDTCLDHFRRIRKLVEETPELRALVKDNGRGVGDAPSGIKDSNGKESIELANGRRLLFKAREKGSGRGFSGDLVVLDEAFWLKDLSGLIPTMAARENPQAWYTSSAPLPRMESDHLRALIRQGRALTAGETVPEPGEPMLAYFEWSTEDVPDDRLCDPEVVADGNPAYGIRIDQTFAKMELQRLGAEAYRRERLGIFPDSDDAAWAVWSEAEWRGCLSSVPPERKRWLADPVTLAYEVTTEYSGGTIAVAGSCPEGIGFDVIERGVNTAWLVPRLIELATDAKRPVGRVVRDPKGPARIFDAELIAAGIVLTDCPASELAAGTGDFHTDLIDGNVVHRDRPEINEAVAQAVKRPYGDMWLIDRRKGDATPITAPIMAVWGHKQAAESPVVDSCW